MPTSHRTASFGAYSARIAPFAQPVFARLRDIIHATCPAATEDIKWAYPHFEYRGDVLCIFAAYRSHCAITFYKDALMTDPRLRANAGLPAAKRFLGRLTGLADLPSDDDLAAWIGEAMALNEKGIKLPPRAPKTPKEIEVPAAFAAELAANPMIEAVFDSKSASYRKDYNLWIGEAKTEATRAKRIAEALSWIAEGKQRFWKYAKPD